MRASALRSLDESVERERTAHSRALLGRILNAYERFVENDHAEAFVEMWERFDLLRDNPITVVQGDERLSGIARGIDSQGALRLELKDGSVLPFLAGDATLDKSGRS